MFTLVDAAIFTAVFEILLFIRFWMLSLVVSLFCCRYASLYFCCAIEDQDNELITLEIIHRYVELLDKYFGSVRLCFLHFRFIFFLIDSW